MLDMGCGALPDDPDGRVGLVGDGLSTDPETQCFTDLYDDKCRLPTISLAHSVFLGGRVSVWHL